MKVSLNWLKDYIDVNIPVEKLADVLTMHSVEVESLEKINAVLPDVIIGEIKEVKKHPNADRLKLVKVDIGKAILEVVCGGANISEHSIGWKVPVAMVGTILPDGRKMEKANIRGVESNGMLCSAEELGMPKQGDREILVLEKTALPGEKISSLFEKDIVLELDVLANRPDLMSHRGVAREIGAALAKKTKPEKQAKLDKPKNSKKLKVTLEDEKLCPRYSALVITGIKIAQSPAWLKQRLNAVGIRSINNIVDLTNYIMMDFGQPLHAFDYDKLAGQTMVVRKAREGEEVKTLDGQIRKLKKGIMIIEDAEKLIDLAGIMGGANSEIDENTNTIVLQAAVFNPSVIRTASQLLGHRTEAVSRYEKSVDASQTLAVLANTFALLKKLNPSAVLEEIIDLGKKVINPVKIKMEFGRVEKLLGINIPENKILNIFKTLGIDIAKKNKTGFTAIVPSFRPDLAIPEDLIEEAARIYGYDKIPETFPKGELYPPKLPETVFLIDELKHDLVGWGFNEVCNYSFIGKNVLDKLGLNIADHAELTNPLSSEQQYLRTELLSGLLNNLELNLKNRKEIRIFEAAKAYYPEKNQPPREPWILCAALTSRENHDLYFQGKGVLESLLIKMGADFISEPIKKMETGECPYWNISNNDKTIKYASRGKIIAVLSAVPVEMLKKFGIEQEVVFFNIYPEILNETKNKNKKFRPLPRFPSVMLDLAFTVDQKTEYRDIEKEIWNFGRPLLDDVEVFDVYSGKQIDSSQKSIAVHLKYGSRERTLALEEAQKAHDAVISRLKNVFGAKIRE